MRILVIILFLFSCTREQLPECFTVHAVVEIQYELYQQRGEKIEMDFYKIWEHTTKDFEEIGVTLVLDELIVWKNYDPYGNYVSPKVRIDNLWEYRGINEGFMRILLGKTEGGRASSYDDRDGYLYSVFRWNRENFTCWYLTHEIGHLLGARHDQTSCNIMNSGQSLCPDVNIKQEWTEQSKNEIFRYIVETCNNVRTRTIGT